MKGKIFTGTKLFLLSLLIGLMIVLPVSAQSYTFTQLDVSDNLHSTVAYGISNDGRVVGQYFFEGFPPYNTPQGFIYNNGTYTKYIPTGSSDTALMDINSAGTFVGRYVRNGAIRGIPINYLWYTTTIWKINELGEMLVRTIQRSGGKSVSREYIYDGQTFNLLTLPGTGYSSFGMNDARDIVGIYYPGGGQASRGFFYNGSTTTTFLYPNSVQTWARGINSDKKIVGTYCLNWTYATNSCLQDHGFIYQDGVFTSFDYPGASSTILQDINDAGQIVGTFNGKHGFIATPA